MGTLLHAVFNAVFGNVYFVLNIFIISDLNLPFPESSQNSVSEKLTFGHFEVIFLNHYISFRAGWLFPVSTLEEELFNEKLSSVAGLRKSCSIPRKSTDFGQF